jgi:hypothetical protein
MPRIIRFHIPSSYKLASKKRHAQGGRGKLIRFSPVAFSRTFPQPAVPLSGKDRRITDKYHA